MEIKGRLIKILPAQTGQSSRGEWKKQEFVIELDGQFSRKVCISAWGEKVDVGTLVEGTMLTVQFDIESREFNGKWYTNLTAWKVETEEVSQQNAPPQPPIESYQPEMDATPVKDDLPF
jgi:hypothetical protein